MRRVGWKRARVAVQRTVAVGAVSAGLVAGLAGPAGAADRTLYHVGLGSASATNIPWGIVNIGEDYIDDDCYNRHKESDIVEIVGSRFTFRRDVPLVCEDVKAFIRLPVINWTITDPQFPGWKHADITYSVIFHPQATAMVGEGIATRSFSTRVWLAPNGLMTFDNANEPWKQSLVPSGSAAQDFNNRNYVFFINNLQIQVNS